VEKDKILWMGLAILDYPVGNQDGFAQPGLTQKYQGWSLLLKWHPGSQNTPCG